MEGYEKAMFYIIRATAGALFSAHCDAFYCICVRTKLKKATDWS